MQQDDYTSSPTREESHQKSDAFDLFSDTEDGRILPLDNPTCPPLGPNGHDYRSSEGPTQVQQSRADDTGDVEEPCDREATAGPPTPVQQSNAEDAGEEEPCGEPEGTCVPPLIGADIPVQPPPPERDIEAEADAFVVPSQLNATRTMNACRFLLDHGHRLVLAWGDDEKPPGVYVISENGRLEVGSLLGMLTETARKYLGQCLNLERSDFRVVSADARALDSAEGWKSVRQAIRAAYHRLEAMELLPPGLDVVGRDFIDADLRYMGAPNGVIDLHEGRLLSAREVRERRAYVLSQIPDDFVPDATHPAVDLIMPEKPTSEEMAWWYAMRGVGFTRAPNREIVAQLSPRNWGKTTIANGDKVSFGNAYVSGVPGTTFAKSKFGNGPGSHNTGLIGFQAPSRIRYMSDADAEMNPASLNQVSGGEATIFARDVSEKGVEFHPSAHLVIQANLPDEAGSSGAGVKFNMHGGNSTAAAALVDRLKFVIMPEILEEERDLGFPDGNLRDGFLDRNNADDSRLRRQAWVARTVRQAVAMAGKTMPPPLKSMNDFLEERRRAEGPLWGSEWLPYVLVPIGDDDSPVASSAAVYESYLRWHSENADENEDGKPASTTAIGRAIGQFYTPRSAGRVNGKPAKVYRGWTLNPAPPW